MPSTRTEKRLSKRRKQAENDEGLILVPLIHELLMRPVDIETVEDADFMHALAAKLVEREATRKSGDSVYSPSGLASCLRRVYLSKHWKQLGLERVQLPAIEPHFYFMTGDFVHLKWQYAFYKLAISQPDRFVLLDTELMVMSKHGDHGGTIDVLAMLKIDGKWELVIIDVKGLNVRNWQAIQNSVPHDYRIQVTDYGMLFNSAVQRGAIKPSKLQAEFLLQNTGSPNFPKVKRAIILAENKGGPDYRHPAAVSEHVIMIRENLPDVRSRLETLRDHAEKETFPDIECESTKGIQFQGCPFAEICRKEVRAKQREIATNKDFSDFRLAKPKRSRRARKARS